MKVVRERFSGGENYSECGLLRYLGWGPGPHKKEKVSQAPASLFLCVLTVNAIRSVFPSTYHDDSLQ